MATIRKRTIAWKTKTGEERTGERWQAQYVDHSGKRYSRAFKLKRDAQNWLDEQTAGLVTGQWVNPTATKQTLKAYAENWLAQQVVRSGTERVYRSHLELHILPRLGHLRLEELTRPLIQALVKEWSQAAAPSTTHGRYHTLAILLRAAVSDRVLVRSPADKIQLPPVPPAHALTPISADTVTAMANAIEPRYRALIIVGAGTGMRRSELLGLTQDRVSADFGTILVDRQQAGAATSQAMAFGPPKTASSHRTIHVAKLVTDAIDEHIETFGLGPEGLVFSSVTGDGLMASTLQAAWATARRKVGAVADDATLHDLRHFFASVQLAGGISVKELQAQLGHKNAAETLDTYGHLMKEDRDHSRQLIQTALKGLEGRRSIQEPPLHL